jgi:hypothetical protein
VWDRPNTPQLIQLFQADYAYEFSPSRTNTIHLADQLTNVGRNVLNAFATNKYLSMEPAFEN